jgi:hypothetical protein
VELLNVCDHGRLEVYGDGGWAVDTGEQTRSQDDLDIALRTTRWRCCAVMKVRDSVNSFNPIRGYATSRWSIREAAGSTFTPTRWMRLAIVSVACPTL